MKIKISDNTSNKHKRIYDDKVLKYGDYRQELEFMPPKGKYKHRNRNIICFNPPYNKCITSNIGRDFLNLITKHFPIIASLLKSLTKTTLRLATVAQATCPKLKKKPNKNRMHQQYNTSLQPMQIGGSKTHAPY